MQEYKIYKKFDPNSSIFVAIILAVISALLATVLYFFIGIFETVNYGSLFLTIWFVLMVVALVQTIGGLFDPFLVINEQGIHFASGETVSWDQIHIHQGMPPRCQQSSSNIYLEVTSPELLDSLQTTHNGILCCDDPDAIGEHEQFICITDAFNTPLAEIRNIIEQHLE